MGRPARAGSAAGVSHRANGKDVGKTGRPCGGYGGINVGEGHFYLFYLRLVLLPHQLVRGRASGKWWAEQDETNSQDQTGIPVRSCLFTSPLLLIISVHISA